MKRIKLVTAYDGTNYHGSQIQNNGKTIEGVLKAELSSLLQEEINLIGASRTDAGVHARGNVYVFDTESRIPPEKFTYALNARLPEDIRVQESCEVPADFHPRHQDTVKTYEYRILNQKLPLPEYRLYAHFTYETLDVEKMNEACRYFIGEHDFASFCAAGSQVESTVREIYDLHVEKNGELLTISVTGNGFLYNMVRIIAGTLLKVGSGHILPEEIEQIIAGKDRALAGPTAPAKGLTLVKFRYPESEKMC
ncbi:MAG: tRNA pseudouridine(38-40) synthase TruA [Lachnospiraceae bacterium]|nr:tRNA pseudouridine(38-40) synthase TruA [Lachnospiraceae bacterium]